MAYRWNFQPLLDNPEVLLAGALGTLRLFVVCLVAGLALGLVVGLARLAPQAPLRFAARAFVEFFRNTPKKLVQIPWFYFALLILLPLSISLLCMRRSASR
ncbi:MAG: ABC transporter permease subunit [Rubrivivax sp.]